MPAKIPTQHKTPFVIDARPLNETATSQAGLLAFSRALRSLHLPGLAQANLKIKRRERGLSEGEFLESLILLQIAGGTCPEDLSKFEGDACLERGLGFTPPRASAALKFLYHFHDEKLVELARPPREVQKSFIPAPSTPLEGLQQMQKGLSANIARGYEQKRIPLRSATIDMDGTIIESHKKTALPHYDGGRGYQPLVAVWAEADLVVADEFRDGNVPGRQEPLTCAQIAFDALPEGVRHRSFRGDSACHENGLLAWLSSPEREREPGGKIGFAISAVMSAELGKALKAIPERGWKTFDTEKDGTLRQWAEVDFVPGNPCEKKDALPLRYVGLRLLKAQGVLFADGSDRHFHAIVTNRTEDGGQLLDWHRQKAGTIEHVHDAVKNGLGGGHMPSQRFGANAAWFKIALLAYNITSALKGLAMDGELKTAEFKKIRLHLVSISGRMSRSQCKLRLRFCAPQKTIARILRVWEAFPLPTQATAFR